MDGIGYALVQMGGRVKEHYWYLRSVDEVFEELESSEEGLTSSQVKQRLERYGHNELEKAERFNSFKVLISKLNTLLVYILTATALLSLWAGHHLEFWVILVIIGFTVLVSWFQEYQAARSVEALESYTARKVSVVRGGKEHEIESRNLVPGDVIVIRRGMILPADIRVTHSSGIRADESILTGESVHKPKHADRIDKQDVPVADQNNILFSGTSIVTGSGRGVVIGTGLDSAIGRISHALKEIGYAPTPLQVRIERMTRRISFMVLGLAALFFVILLLQGQPMLAALILVGAVAVGGIPEGFPLVLTIALTHGVRKMAERNALVKDMSSVETLGTSTIICTDKTGTLTQNRMRATRIALASGDLIHVEGHGYEPIAVFRRGHAKLSHEDLDAHAELLEVCVFCSNAQLSLEDGEWTLEGEPTEGALLALAKAAGCDEEVMREDHPRTDEVPFDPEAKFMVTVHDSTAYLKGALERVLEKCSHVRVDGTVRTLSKPMRESIVTRGHELTDDALRVIAFATKKRVKRVPKSGYTFEGMVGIEDPLRPEAISAVEECKRAGIGVVMITGDHVNTARSIAQRVGILTKQRNKVLEASELDKMEDEDLDGIIGSVAVFARATPEHKLRIVKSLQRNGEIVAMTGDGVNDAPALKKADLGVAMGKHGTEVARQASNLVLADDNFGTIVDAVRQGRTIYSNIRRFIFYLLTANFTEVSLIILAVAIGLSAPLTALFILTINVLTSVIPALALAVEPTNSNVMTHRPRHPDERLLSNYLLTKILVLIPLTVTATIGVFWYSMEILGRSLEYAQTMVFATIIVFELFHVFNARSLHTSIFSERFLKNPYIFLAIAATLSLTLLILYVPALQVVFGTVPLTGFDWLVITAIGSSIVVFSEIVKLLVLSEIREQNLRRQDIACDCD
ncbi:MAG: cation-translocating P-type ATPase [Candidatus Woesearchaeota archaeon]